WPWLAGVVENRSDALIDGLVPGGVFGLWIRLDRPQGEGVIALGEFEGDAGDGCRGGDRDWNRPRRGIRTIRAEPDRRGRFQRPSWRGGRRRWLLRDVVAVRAGRRAAGRLRR